MTNLITTLYSIAWSDYVSTSSTHDSDINIIITSAKITLSSLSVQYFINNCGQFIKKNNQICAQFHLAQLLNCY